MDVNSLILASQREAERYDRMKQRARIAEAGGTAWTPPASTDGTRARRFLGISIRTHVATTLIAIGGRLSQPPDVSGTGIGPR